MTNDSASRIQGAIVKLERLKAESVPGPWAFDQEGTRRKLRGAEGKTVLGCSALLWPDPAEADLIVTLHRTIDAQLAILQHGFLAYSWWDRHDEPLALALANAILGED